MVVNYDSWLISYSSPHSAFFWIILYKLQRIVKMAFTFKSSQRLKLVSKTVARCPLGIERNYTIENWWKFFSKLPLIFDWGRSILRKSMNQNIESTLQDHWASIVEAFQMNWINQLLMLPLDVDSWPAQHPLELSTPIVTLICLFTGVFCLFAIVVSHAYAHPLDCSRSSFGNPLSDTCKSGFQICILIDDPSATYRHMPNHQVTNWILR